MLSQLWTMTLTDLRQRVRDRSVLIFGIVVPLALMYVFNLVFGDTEDLELRPTTVVASVPAGDELGSTVLQVLGEIDLGAFRVTVEEAPADQVRSRVEGEEAHLGILLPEGFGAAVRSGQPTAVRVVEGTGRDVENQVVLSVVDGVLQQFTASTQAAAAAGASGLPPERLESIARDAVERAPGVTSVEGETADEQLNAAASLVAGQAGLFMLFTVGFGVLGLVIERDNGTLDRLKSMPMRPGLPVLAKALTSLVLGVVATGVLLGVGGVLFDVGFGSLPVTAVLVVMAVAAATSVMFVIVRVARTSEQAGIAQSIVALVLGIAGGAFFPVDIPGVVGRVLELNPVAAFIRGLGVSSGGGGLGDIGGPLVTMLGFAAVMLVLARVLPDRGVAS